jgi:ABC-type uncharacterized transport system substrate-binding protein
MRRREFIAGLGGAAAWPMVASAQQPAMPVVGFLHPASIDVLADRVRAFRQGLKDTGFIEGENVAVEYRWAEDQTERLPALAAELVRRRVAVIAAVGGNLRYLRPRWRQRRLVGGDPFFNSRRVQLALLAARHAVPTIYASREYAEIGGLISYGPNFLDAFRNVGVYVGRILKGAKPADMPIEQSTRFELVINLQAAKVIGYEVPAGFLLRADAVIE